MLLLLNETHLVSRHSPHIEVVRPHEDIRNSFPYIPHNPLVKVFGLGVCDSSLHCRINHTLQALHLILLRQHGDVVLEWVRHPEVLVAHVGDTLVCVPVGLVGEGFVDAVVEVLVVGEDDMAADVVELGGSVSELRRW